MILDRPALIRAVLATLVEDEDVPWPVGLVNEPAAGGGDPSGTFTPYIIVDPQTSTYTGSMRSTVEHDQTPIQMRCVSNVLEESDLTGRASVMAQQVVKSLVRARRRGDLDTEGQKVTVCRLDVVNGPFRDTHDDRIYIAHPFLRFHTART